MSVEKFLDRQRTLQVLRVGVKADIVEDLEIADNSSYLQAGTGAVSRSLEARLRDTVYARDFDCVGDGVTDDTANLQKAATYAGTVGARLNLGAGNFLCTADIAVPVGNYSPDISGEGWNTTRITFSGAGVTHGLYYLGDSSTYPFMGTVKDIMLLGANNASCGLTAFGVNHPRLERVQIRSFKGCGVSFDYTLMGKLDQCLFVGNGSASHAQLEVDNSTTFLWLHSRISGSQTGTIAGIMVDRSQNTTIIGGNIESTGLSIKVQSKSDGVLPSQGGFIQSVGFENPGDNNSYIEMGYGWTGATGGGVKGWNIVACVGSPSGTTSQLYAVKLKHTTGMTFDNNVLGLTGSPLGTFYLEGSTNIGCTLREHRMVYGSAWPYVLVNGAHRPDATPLGEWHQTAPQPIDITKFLADADGVTPSVLYYPTQGGVCSFISFTHSTSFTVDSMLGLYVPMKLYFQAQNGNTTLKHHKAAAVFPFDLTAGVDLNMVSGRIYPFFYDGAYIRQL